MEDREDEHQIWGSTGYTGTGGCLTSEEFKAQQNAGNYIQTRIGYILNPAKPPISPNIWKAMGWIVLFYALAGLIWWMV